MAATGGHFHYERGGASYETLRWAPMRLLGPLLVAVVAACTDGPSPMQATAGPVRASDVSSELLSAHNHERVAAAVPPLVWDNALASAAAGYAVQLAARGALRHSPREARAGQGENLWMGTRGAYVPLQMVASWASEKSRFRPGIFPMVSRTGNWADVGHYSQVIWPTTTRLGCAIASGARSDFLVCRYAPAGNVDGRRVP